MKFLLFILSLWPLLCALSSLFLFPGYSIRVNVVRMRAPTNASIVETKEGEWQRWRATGVIRFNDMSWIWWCFEIKSGRVVHIVLPLSVGSLYAIDKLPTKWKKKKTPSNTTHITLCTRSSLLHKTSHCECDVFAWQIHACVCDFG